MSCPFEPLPGTTRSPYLACIGLVWASLVSGRGSTREASNQGARTPIRAALRPSPWSFTEEHTRNTLPARASQDQTGRRESAELPNGRPWPPLTGACAVRIWKHTGKASAGPHKRFSGHVERATHMDLAEENQDVNTLQLPSVRHGSQWRKKARALAWTCCLLWTVESPRPRPGGRCTGAYLLPSIPGRPRATPRRWHQ